jgi:hypothetical protein
MYNARCQRFIETVSERNCNVWAAGLCFIVCGGSLLFFHLNTQRTYCWLSDNFPVYRLLKFVYGIKFNRKEHFSHSVYWLENLRIQNCKSWTLTTTKSHDNENPPKSWNFGAVMNTFYRQFRGWMCTHFSENQMASVWLFHCEQWKCGKF